MNIKRLTVAIILVFSTVVLFADNLSIDAAGMGEDHVLMELMLDWDQYEGKLVEINNISYGKLGIKGKFDFYQASQWFREASRLHPSTFMYEQNISFLFNPASDDREAKKWVLQATGKYYTNPVATDMVVKPLSHTLNTGLKLYFVVIKSMTFKGNTYKGTLPDRITQ